MSQVSNPQVPEPRIPEPNGPPQVSSRVQEVVLQTAKVTGLFIVGGAAAFLVLAAVPQRTMGALRSGRVKLQERRQAIGDLQAQVHTAQDAEPGHD